MYCVKGAMSDPRKQQKLMQRDTFEKAVLFVLMLYIPVHNFSVILAYFLGLTNIKQRTKAQAHNKVPLVGLEPAIPQSQV